MGLTQTSAPSLTPVSVTDAKKHLRIDHTEDDSYISDLIDAAVEEVENITNRQLITATFAYTLDRFPQVIMVPKPKLITVSSIQYVDTQNATQTLASSVYTVITNEEVGRIVEADGESWPSTNDVPAAVTVTYTAGYGDTPSEVPAKIRQAIKIVVADLYEHRNDQSELRLTNLSAVENLLWSFRVGLFS